MTPNAPGIEVDAMPVELKCAIVLLEHIRDTIPLRPSERQITREEANALLADRSRLQAQLEAVRKDAERLNGRTIRFGDTVWADVDLRAAIDACKEPK